MIEIYTDGACSGNPGPGGYGTILRYKDSSGQYHEKEISAGYKHTTNNRMELLAVIVGLEALKKDCKVKIYSDSKYFIDAFEKKWIVNWKANNWKTATKKSVKNVDLWKRLIQVMDKYETELIWVKGHNGHFYNERCDELAVNASKSNNLLDDEIIQ
ncbi:MAG: ribonuclease HI [Candidatus Gastranaerophilales bacterium]